MYKVLIVEDDPMVAMINEQYILKNKNFCVCGICKNGAEALDYLRNNHVDLVLLDVYLPIMDGREVLTEIRNSKIDTEVIMVTAANDTSTLEETVHLGIVDYLIKPFSFARFQNALQKFTVQHQVLKERTTMNQDVVDNLINLNNPNMFPVDSNKDESQKYPKGIQAKTLEMLKNHLQSVSNWQSVDMIAGTLGISLVTVRHYMNYLVKNNYAIEDIDYETGGRPCLLYKKNN